MLRPIPPSEKGLYPCKKANPGCLVSSKRKAWPEQKLSGDRGHSLPSGLCARVSSPPLLKSWGSFSLNFSSSSSQPLVRIMSFFITSRSPLVPGIFSLCRYLQATQATSHSSFPQSKQIVLFKIIHFRAISPDLKLFLQLFSEPSPVHFYKHKHQAGIS